MRPMLIRACFALFLLHLLPHATQSAAAGDLSRARGSFVDEIRVGVLAANLENGGDGGDYTINTELLFSRLGGPYNDSVFDTFFHPRPHVGASLSPDGVNQLYAGLTWDYHLTNSLFVESSFGGAAHDGETAKNNPDSYGCSVQFRESASVGFELTQHVRLMATVDHMSNAGLCGENQGLTNAGVRLGYRW
jgi:lipid A 3-O-deacylase